MKVKELQKLLYRLSEDGEVVLLNEEDPITATNAITQVYTVSTPMRCKDAEGVETDGISSKIILAYRTRGRGEK